MTEAMPFLQKQYYFLMTPDHWPGLFFDSSSLHPPMDRNL